MIKRIIYLTLALALPICVLQLFARPHVNEVAIPESQILIDLFLPEAVVLRNVGETAVNIQRWTIQNQAGDAVQIPVSVELPSRGTLWLAKEDALIGRWFGFRADFEAENSNHFIPQLQGSWPDFSQTSGIVYLRDPAGNIVDTLAYGASRRAVGWIGQPAHFSGQLLHRQRDEFTQRPLDTHSATDWTAAMFSTVTTKNLRFSAEDLLNATDAYQTYLDTLDDDGVSGNNPKPTNAVVK